MNFIPQLYSNGRRENLISDLTSKYKKCVLTTAILIIQDVIKLINKDSRAFMFLVTSELSKAIAVSLVEFITQKNVFRSKRSTYLIMMTEVLTLKGVDGGIEWLSRHCKLEVNSNILCTNAQ